MSKIASLVVIIVGVVTLLVVGKQLLIPLIIALFIWFLIRETKTLLNKIVWIKEKMPFWLKNACASGIIFSILGIMAKVLMTNINQLAQSYPLYESNIETVIAQINSLLEIDLMNAIGNISQDLNFGNILEELFNSLTDMIGSAFLILLYTLFIFLEEAFFRDKLKIVFAKKEQFERVSSTLIKIEKSITRYIGLKTLISLTTGTLSYVALMIIGIESPVFWAFLIFIMNFIPTIGSLVSTVLPAIFSLLQFGELLPALTILLVVGTIQVIIGNIIEPRLMGNTLNISPLIAILSLTFWGAIWGVTGMLISVPVMVIIVIILSLFERTKPLAIMFSEKGKIS